MSGTRQALTVSAVVSIVASVEAGVQAETKPELTLSLQNAAQISAGVVDDAARAVVKIYRVAGIDVRWKPSGTDVTVVIAPPPYPAAVRNFGFALGYAPRAQSKSGRLVFALSERVANTAQWLGVPHSVVLGITVAHEVGHLLLPYDSHAASGIMRNEWTQSDYRKARLGQLLFTDAEARLIRTELLRRKRSRALP